MLALAAGCANEIGGRDGRDAAALDAPAADAPAAEADAPVDVADAPVAPTDAPAGTDAPSPLLDAGPPCTPTRTSCRGELECGLGPNGCPGGVLDCGECTGGEAWCAVLPDPPWLARVMSCVGSVISAHPEYFDFAMACSGSAPLVLPARAAEYVRDVAACVNGSGAVAIADPNAPEHEIRVRAEGGDVADNYPVRVYSSGCTRRAYTSSCTPAMF